MLHVLDIAMNAVTAGARTVKIRILEAPEDDRLELWVADNGPGMPPEFVAQVLESYATTKTKRKGWVGFGLALLRGTVDLCEGEFTLLSRPGVGTLVKAILPYGHPDRPPLGDVAESLQSLLAGCPSVDLCFEHRRGEQGYRLDTRPVRREVGDAYATRAVRRWLVDRIREGEQALAVGSELS